MVFFRSTVAKGNLGVAGGAVLCGGLMAIFHLFPFYFGLVPGWDSALYMTYVALGAFATLASASMLSIGFSFMLSPRLSSPGALSGASVLLGLIAHTLLHVFINFILNFALHSAALEWPRAFASLPLGVIFACAFLALVIRRIRRPGNESWFRLES